MLTQEHVSALQRLAEAVERTKETTAARDEAVQLARREGASWASIGALLGISKQAAAVKYSASAALRGQMRTAQEWALF